MMASDDRSVLTAAVGTGSPQKSKTYRRVPSEAEQERRREWGKKWGKLVGDATRGIAKGQR